MNVSYYISNEKKKNKIKVAKGSKPKKNITKKEFVIQCRRPLKIDEL